MAIKNLVAVNSSGDVIGTMSGEESLIVPMLEANYPGCDLVEVTGEEREEMSSDHRKWKRKPGDAKPTKKEKNK